MVAFAALFVTATKLAGILVTVTVAANAFSFSRFRKKNLRPFRSPIDETSDVLADFNLIPSNEEENGFFFGLATAPAHVEDRLKDAWLEFAKEEPTKEVGEVKTADALMASASADGGSQQAPVKEPERSKKKKTIKVAMEAMIRGFEKYSEEDEEEVEEDECSHNVAAWHNVPHPEERLRFWSDPDTELKLAKDTGVRVFRMGIDWSRIMPKEPVNGLDTVNYAALERYKWIIQRVRSYGMKVMLTLFHHSLPPWAGKYGGWKLEKTVDYFIDFTRLVVDSVADLVDYWITFNEPHVFCMLTYCAGAWPGGNPDMLEVATSALPTGVFNQTMHWIAIAHSKAYDCIHGQRKIASKAIVGVAHHVSFMRPYGLFDIAAVSVANSLTLFPFMDSVCNEVDFMGINYYGQEVLCGAGMKFVENDEYSESGRGVYPDGLYRMLLQFHERYKHLKVPFVITENGVSDETDLIRRPYLLEHLLAVYAAMKTGVPVLGYLFWTISDNWEWADGYGPKFGLVAVDRANDLARIPRPSYHLFSKVATTKKITRKDRAYAWNELQRAAREKQPRPFYRAVNERGLMYAGGLDKPDWKTFTERDWRFGHYRMDGLQDPLSRLSRSILRPLLLTKSVNPDADDADLVLEPLVSV
ncbi:galactolipid galactosyltransferase [Ranunculus cassubicifolius]